ncbi:MAG TPA: hypothetical protein DCM08_01100 [Microscillaceae bacterium]|jgi:hypothetical protein|nr:hypothetical protein [Microscillaceae bacterium]
MKSYQIAIWVTTLYLVFYTLTPHLNIASQITIAMFLGSPFMVAWMVLSILIQADPSQKTLTDGSWYEDYTPKNSEPLG